MIIKKFEEIVERYPGNISLKTTHRSLTYEELNFKANQVAHALKEEGNGAAPGSKQQQVALLFDYGIDMIAGLLGALKAGKTYVPLDYSYPGKRLLYILEDSETYLILTDNRNFPLAEELSQYADGRIAVLNIGNIGEETPGTGIHRKESEEGHAYILYTSGTSGKPKGVIQTHRNVAYFAGNCIRQFSIDETCRMSLFTAFTHDGAIPDIYSALLSGACLYPYYMREKGSVTELSGLIKDEKINIWHSTPSLFRYFTTNLNSKDSFPELRWILLGGEPVRAHDLELYKSHFDKARLVNIYGQTECTVSSLCILNPENTYDDVTLGESLPGAAVFLLDEDDDMVEEMGGGEIVVACDYCAPGYWRDEENTQKVFLHDDRWGRIYRTGDLGRLTPSGHIKILGRKDFQVKIRGFRIEPEEIESELLHHNGVQEAVVTALEDENEENYLCAYIVSNMAISSEDLREYLFSELPDYMVPRHFVFLEKMPLNPSGKIDRQQLPEPGKVVEVKTTYVAPSNEVEKKITAIWQEVLKVDKIGVNDNFTELGGHSLLIMSIVTKIHQELNVELQLTDIFDNPTVKELSQLVMESKQKTFSSIEPVEMKEYYPLSPAQKRLYVLQQLKLESTAYNLPAFFTLSEEFESDKLEEVLKRLLERHESFRTSFILADNEPVQRICRQAILTPSYFEVQKEEEINTIMDSFTQPFDLTRAPLLRMALVKVEGGKYVLMVDMHHLISDGLSLGILIRDFERILGNNPLSPLRIQYKDFSHWRNSYSVKNALKSQEQYWLNQLAGELPVLNIPTDFSRTRIRDFEGRTMNFQIDKETTERLNILAKEEDLTVFIALFSLFNVLLSNLSLQEDIVVGTDVAGRNHAHLEPIVGMFVNTLVIRTYPNSEKSFQVFLSEVREKILDAFENQDYPLEELVGKLDVNREPGRNPLFDVMFSYEKVDAGPAADESKETAPAYKYINKTAKFELALFALEMKNKLYCCFEYSNRLFKEERIRNFIGFFQEILAALLEDRTTKLKDIPIGSRHVDAEQLELPVEFAF